MRVRGVVASVLLCCAFATGCSSSGKPSASDVAAGGGLGLGGAPSGVTAGGSARQTVPADLAFVVVGLSGNGSNGSSQFITGSNGAPIPVPTENPNAKNPDHKAIRAAITSLGLPQDAVEFSAESSNFGNADSVVEIEVPVAKLPNIAHDVVDAVRKTGAKISGR